MATKTITITKDAYERLKPRKRDGERFTETIIRTIEGDRRSWTDSARCVTSRERGPNWIPISTGGAGGDRSRHCSACCDVHVTPGDDFLCSGRQDQFRGVAQYLANELRAGGVVQFVGEFVDFLQESLRERN